MFKEDFYCELRKDFERSERNGEEPFLCSFLRKEKERDIRILIRTDRLKINDSQDTDSLVGNLRNFLEDMLYFMAKDLTRISKCKAKEKLFRLVDIEKDVREIGGRSGLKKAIERKIEKTDTLFEKMDENELERQKENLIKAGKLIIGLWDDAKREDPYIALREEYLDYRLGERTKEEVLEKTRSIDSSYRKKYAAEEFEEKVGKIIRGKAEISNLEELEETVTQLSSAVLKAEAKAFLYDAGFPLQPRTTKKGTELSGEEEIDRSIGEETDADRETKTARRQDRTMDLVSDYCDRHGISAKGKGMIHTESGSADIDSKEFRDTAEKLYHALRKDNRTTAYVPLCIDEKNGAGIYIIGSEFIPNTSYRGKKWAHEAKGWSCLYCCLHGSDLDKINKEDEKDKRDKKDKRDEVDEQLTIYLHVEICEDIEEAIRIFAGYRDEYGIYWDYNEKPVQDVDERFLPYFYSEED